MNRNPEYQFVSTDTNVILSSMISAYERITGVSVKPASPERLFIQWVADVIIQERVLNNYTGNQNLPSRAEGANLDALGELFYGKTRQEAQPAVCTQRFYISGAQNTSIPIPAYTRVTDASSTLIWETTEDANTIDEKTIELLFASSRRPDMDVFRALFGIKGKFRMSWEKKEKGETYDEALSRIMADNANAQNTTLLFWGAYCNLESPDATCLSWGKPIFSASEKLKVLYDYLSSLGYDMSDEEKALMDGSHELYDEADPDDDDEHDECDDDMPSE